MNPRVLLSFFLLLPLLLSCSLQKYCSKRFPPEIIRKDSIRFVEKVVYRDTLLYMHIKGDTIYDTLVVDTTGSASSILETSFARSTATFNKGKLFHELSQKDSLMSTLVERGIKERYVESFEGSRETSVIVKNELTGWQHTQIYAAWILAGIMLVQLLWRKFLTGVFTKLLKYFKSAHPP